ncbi:MAG: glycosyltransferase involved in cell wall biosynthesis [Candidatus Azotimanducaceae bacterium]|jgi:glycosyltransferase involved in cell wall biosynthesis
MKILLLSPYDAMSHQYWHQRLRSDLDTLLLAEVVLVTLPARYFSWRFRGNSLTLAHDERLKGKFDLVIATSMTDLAALLGMAPNLSGVPEVLYFHENQFAYPDANEVRQVERQVTSIYSAIAATSLVFNSNFNRDSFMQGAAVLLKKMPDGVPDGVVAQLQKKSRVISVPIDAALFEPRADPNARDLTLVWNHRWEYDKGLDELVALIELLKSGGLPFKCHLIGQSFRTIPTQLQAARDHLGASLGVFGFVADRAQYLKLLNDVDVVVSTARQEFQGIAVLEAIAAGCCPVVPDSLAYREFVPEAYRYQSVAEAAAMIRDLDPLKSAIALPKEVRPETVQRGWQQLLGELLQ